MNDLRLIEAALALPVASTFTYSVPGPLTERVCEGMRVLVPFGRRRVTGYVLGAGQSTGKFHIKSVLDVLDASPVFPPNIIPFFRWIADYYLHPIGEVITCALPGGMTVCDAVRISLTPAGNAALSEESLGPLEKQVMGELARRPSEIRSITRGRQAQVPLAMIDSMERRGLIYKECRLKGGTTRVKTERFISLGAPDIPDTPLPLKRRQVLEFLAADGGAMPVKNLKDRISVSDALLRGMAEDGWVTVEKKEVYRDPFGEPIARDVPRILTAEQSKVVEEVGRHLGKGFRSYLLAGVTGSGKTEVYLHLAHAAMEKGTAVLVLVPEIALISQMERRFRARFGERIALLHSGLSAGERLDQWMRILRGEIPIVIGARSAIFAPFRKTGLIIVDEEHDTSYKQVTDLRYNARDLALVRAKQDGAVAVLGSATPSVHSYYNVRTGKFTELTLPRRVEARSLPDITVVDLKKTKDDRGARQFITPVLHQAIRDALDRKEQVLLFLNRRGFASFPVCARCGSAVMCRHCDITLTLHRLEGAYRCHYCGFSRQAADGCPECGAGQIKLLGLGTEKVEGYIRTLFPDARAARLDRDTTTRKGSVVRILKAVKTGAIDVLVGTQMVAKGHDFPNITLVGIICADLTLSFPDFRASERTFQLLAQVAGRAGRGDSPGRVILQTYQPDHFSILAAKQQDFRAFFKTEIAFRRALNYPPFSRIIHIQITGRDPRKTRERAEAIGVLASAVHAREHIYQTHVEVLGPIEAPVHRVADRFRWQILVKGNRVAALHRFIRQVMAEKPGIFDDKQVQVVVDVDPFFMN